MVCLSDAMLVALLHLDNLALVNHIITPKMQAILVYEDGILEIRDISVDLRANLKPNPKPRKGGTAFGYDRLVDRNWKKRNIIRVTRVQRAKAYSVLSKMQQDPDSHIECMDALPKDLYLENEGFGQIFARGVTIPTEKQIALQEQSGYTLRLRYGKLKKTVTIKGPDRSRDAPFILRFSVAHDGWIYVNGSKAVRVFAQCPTSR